MIWAPLHAIALVTRSLRTKYPSNSPTTGVSFREWGLNGKTGCMADNPYWDGKVHRAVKSGDRTVTGTAKDPRIYQIQRAERARLNAIAAAEIQAAKYARLPWPVRTIGRVVGLFYKVTER
jgi:hypothetical protein